MTTLALGAAFLSPSAGAFTYLDSDLILVLRQDQFNDLEFNLSPVTSYTGLAPGTKITVSNWDSALALSTYGGTLSDVSFALISATAPDADAPSVFLTDSAADTPVDLTGSKYRNIYSKVRFVGTQAELATGRTSSTAYLVSPSDISSFTYIATSGGLQPIDSLGGTTAFPVLGAAAQQVGFFQLAVSTVTPKPAALQVGSFLLSESGELSFTAGVPSSEVTAPTIVSIQRSGDTSTLVFTTEPGVKYRILWSDDLLKPLDAWIGGGTEVLGDGSQKTLEDAGASNSRFYRIEATR